MIAVERFESDAPPGAVEKLLGSLDTSHGAWLGCDVEAEGLYRRESMGCMNPALGFSLEGNVLKVLALSPVGHALLEHVRPLAAFAHSEGELTARFPHEDAKPHPVVAILRSFLALFATPHPELALFGALSFDYHRLAGGEPLPDDGRQRMMLYFPERVLVAKEGRARWVEFRFPELAQDRNQLPAVMAARRLERDADDLPPGGHAERVRRGIERLARGEVFSLVLSQAFRRRTTVRPSEAFGALRKLNPYPAMFFLNLGGGETLFGASPDLQVRADSEYVESAPVCGTFRRGADPVSDADQALALLSSGKEDASLSVCADSDRNDKAKVCSGGSLELVTHRRVHFFSTIIHTIAHTRGRRRSDVDVFDILLAHSNPATVTGVPKPAAIRAIEELEETSRGWYAGAAARLATDGSMEVLTVLRAARVVGEIAEVRTGGNLLVDSDPDKEEEETRLKAETMFRVLSGVSPRTPRIAEAFDARHRATVNAANDPMGPLLVDCLASVGCASVGEDSGAIVLRSDRSPRRAESRSSVMRPELGVGEGGLALLEEKGGRLTTLREPRYARRIRADVIPGGFLDFSGPVEVGLYAMQVVEKHNLPAGWRPVLMSEEGWVIAAQSEAFPQVAILCRPDSVQSMPAEAGRRILRAALDWMADRASQQ